MKKLVIAGGTGFLGSACINYFQKHFDQIMVLTRNVKPAFNNVRFVQWDAKNPGAWCDHIDGSDVLINMTGRSVDCRYTAKNKKIILDSRVDSTLVLGEAIAKAQKPPKIWLNSATATIYRHSLDKEMSEHSGDIGTGFSVNVATAWETAFFSQNTPLTRKVALRTSIVLGPGGGAFTPIKNLAKMGLGGKQGPGNQKFSWIYIDDFLRCIEFIMARKKIFGPVNIAVPQPVTNAELMRSVRKVVGMPFGLPISKPLLKLGAAIIRTETELVLKSRNVIPTKLLQHGFEFRYPVLEDALQHCI